MQSMGVTGEAKAEPGEAKPITLRRLLREIGDRMEVDVEEEVLKAGSPAIRPYVAEGRNHAVGPSVGEARAQRTPERAGSGRMPSSTSGRSFGSNRTGRLA